MLREGGHRPRDARAFLSVCGTHSDITKIDHKAHTTHTKERTPVVHLALAYLTHSGRVTEVARGANARPGRSPKTNGEASEWAAQAPLFFRGSGDRNDASFLLCGRTGFGVYLNSVFSRGEWGYDERVMLDVSFPLLAKVLGSEDDPLESIAVPHLLAIAYAVGPQLK